jgi:predicted nucleic acid-binding protein
MDNMKVVLDASVLLKFSFLEEDCLEQALMLREKIVQGQIRAYIPDFCLHECANTIARLRLPFLGQADAFGLYKDLRLIGCVEFQLDDSFVLDTFRLLYGISKVSFYDALYHALAFSLNAIYVTADQKYYDLMKHKGNIQLLRDFTE